jgi:ClpP class serine protease
VKGELKAEIDRFYDLFVSSVAVGRKGLTEKAIRATEARTYIGADAVKVRLADSVGSFENVLADLSRKSPPRRPKSPETKKSFMENVVFTRTQLGAAIIEARNAECERIRYAVQLSRPDWRHGRQ